MADISTAHPPQVGFTVLYRWRLRPGAEADFVKSWTRLSELLRSERGSLGSRLHRGPDDVWYSYAQWPSAEARKKAFAQDPVDASATELMRASIAETLPEIALSPVVDLLVLPAKQPGPAL
jgi:heme-degrading monooxygenase HmoA